MRSNRPIRVSRCLATTYVITSVLFLQLVGCHEPHRRYTEQFDDGETIPILHQVCRAHSSEYSPIRVVVRDPATFARLPIVDIPIDFEREMLLVATLGEVASDRYEIRIERVWRDGNRIRVKVATTPPPHNAPIVQASPFCAAIVPRSDLNVVGFLTEPPSRRRTR